MQALLSPRSVTARDPSPSRRSIRSYLPGPFAGKSRTSPDFFVEADDPHKRYSAGDAVTGTISLRVSKAVRITHIVLCLHGYVQVYKNPGAQPTDHRTHIAKGQPAHRGGAYHGNGFATLFEEEMVICGDGRLDGGRYRFKFSIKFPEVAMPSSIQFETGTIAYMLTATMTKPTTIAPVTYHDQKILYTQKIDTCSYLPPKPRTITLEPLLRSNTGRGSRRQKVSEEEGPDRLDQGRPSPPVTPVTEGRPTINDSPSTQSLDSQANSIRRSVSSMTATSSRNGDGGVGNTRRKTITATVESLKGGCLRGEELPVRIVINHNKHVKSMHGVFLTIFRLARIDTQPALAIGPVTVGASDPNRKQVRDMYYPQSKTGLGGLSLSGTGSSHRYRKDLAQTVLPLIIDPATLTAEMTPKIRMPDDAFPTIANVPGGMISFKYYIEVILDIQGKAAAQDRSSYAMSAGLMDGHHREMIHSGSPSHGGRESVNGSIIDTSWLRREKSVVACTLEVVVGTHDSERRKAANKAPIICHETPIDTAPADSSRDYGWRPSRDTPDSQQGNGPRNARAEAPHDVVGEEDYFYDDTWSDDHGQYAQPSYSGPPGGYDDGLTEKERLRRAEAALLPSQPPGEDDEMAEQEDYSQYPVAPILNEEDDYYQGAAEYAHASCDDGETRATVARNVRRGRAGLMR